MGLILSWTGTYLARCPGVYDGRASQEGESWCQFLHIVHTDQEDGGAPAFTFAQGGQGSSDTYRDRYRRYPTPVR